LRPDTPARVQNPLHGGRPDPGEAGDVLDRWPGDDRSPKAPRSAEATQSKALADV
jgi:hypothetical protein